MTHTCIKYEMNTELLHMCLRNTAGTCDRIYLHICYKYRWVITSFMRSQRGRSLCSFHTEQHRARRGSTGALRTSDTLKHINTHTLLWYLDLLITAWRLCHISNCGSRCLKWFVGVMFRWSEELLPHSDISSFNSWSMSTGLFTTDVKPSPVCLNKPVMNPVYFQRRNLHTINNTTCPPPRLYIWQQ